MKLYLSHPSGYDYQTELYAPLKHTLGKDHDIFFPHDEHIDGVKSNEIIPTCEAVIAEVSLPSTGQGIELGWADAGNIPIICIYKQGAKISSALRFISKEIIEYNTEKDLIEKLTTAISKYS